MSIALKMLLKWLLKIFIIISLYQMGGKWMEKMRRQIKGAFMAYWAFWLIKYISIYFFNETESSAPQTWRFRSKLQPMLGRWRQPESDFAIQALRVNSIYLWGNSEGIQKGKMPIPPSIFLTFQYSAVADIDDGRIDRPSFWRNQRWEEWQNPRR